MTLIESVNTNIKKAPLSIEKVAAKENVSVQEIVKYLKAGRLVIPCNKKRKLQIDFEGIGYNLRTKINANIGTSTEKYSLREEIKKLETAIDAKTDAVMDLSTGGDIGAIRRELISICNKPFGTVPIYEAFIRASKRGDPKKTLTAADIFEVIEEQAEDGVDFMTVHCGLSITTVERLKRTKRLTGIVSRGGTFLAAWMVENSKENPLYENFEQLLKIAKKYDITLSLGDGLRPGCLKDASDRPQIQEMIILGELAQLANESGIQVIIEGPGHMPLNEIEANIKLEKKVCNGAPYYVLGPLVTDIAPGYDHITSAIGGAIAAMAGADFLCYVTPSEHLGLPVVEDVKEGIIAARIAAHAGDICKLNTFTWDNKMSEARKNLDWEMQIALAIDPQKAKNYLSRRGSKGKVCSMCGEYCVFEIVKKKAHFVPSVMRSVPGRYRKK